jgi:uncharacterized protein YndB with AHSA1/START domain
MSFAATVSRSIDAPPARVWRAITTAELAAWFWPPRFAASAALDRVVGGELRIRSEAMGMGVTGEVVELVEGERVLVTWRWDDEDGETLLALGVEPEGDGSLVSVVQEGFPTAEAAEEHAQGWRDCLDRLPAHLEANPA